MKIERIQHDYYTYAPASHERINANIKKTETASAVSADEEHAKQRQQGQKHQAEQKQEATQEQVAPEALPAGEVAKAGIDIRV